MPLKIFNTLSGAKEDFVPLKEGEVRMYVCGVTVYDSSHLGHCRFLLTFDVIYRYLGFLGFRVVYVRNFTDVDDKIIKRARDENTTCEAITERYIEEFRRDAAALGLAEPTYEPRATHHVPEIISLIRKLEEKGLAYRVDGDVFYRVSGFAQYGKLSRKNLDELQAGARVEVDERKGSPLDFALWKSSKPGEPAWPSPWGPGRPGWHIECSAMSTKYLGQPFDIHGGGRDLIFPHHENEIAQSEGAFGVPLARYWIHNGFLNIDHEKMSKSLGNIFTIHEVLQKYDAAALRHYFLSSHYRSPMDFSFQGLEEAGRAVERVYETLERATPLLASREGVAADAALLESFRREMDDDFNTPRALALLFEEVRSVNRRLDERKIEGLEGRVVALRRVAQTLGLMQDGAEAFFERKKERWLRQHGLQRRDIEALIEARDRARKEKRWSDADRIREELQAKGIVLEDGPSGTVWKVK
ncbi:MAG TPA: cysteine--tRNA ligase [candidate division Zixibacteria bacterium]|nr:cysteine--tRNA ligase [candidate division Zixibacteria bacterium]